MAQPITGGCLCGAVTYAIKNAPRFAIKCYCEDCRRISGAGHLPQVAYARDGFEPDGPLKVHRLKADSGSDLEIGFCPECSATIFKTTSRAADMIFVAAGTLDAGAEVPEMKPVFEEGRQDWDS